MSNMFKIALNNEDREWLEDFYERVLCITDDKCIDEEGREILLSFFSLYGVKMSLVCEYNEDKAKKNTES